MTLLRFDDDEEKKKKDQIFNRQAVQSLQDSWQPSQQTDLASGGVGTNVIAQAQPTKAPQNYLLSEEKIQHDEQIKAQREAEAQAAAQRAAQAAHAVQRQKQRQAPAPKIQGDTDDWKKFYQSELDKANKEAGFFGRMFNSAGIQRLAQQNARNRATSQLLRQAYDDSGNVIDPQAEARARQNAYSGTAFSDYATRAGRADLKRIGADKRYMTAGERAGHALEALNRMSVGSAVLGADNEQEFDLRDVGRFGTDVLSSVFLMPARATRDLKRAVTGRGYDQETGELVDLSGSQRAGALGAGVLNMVSPFIGGSGTLLKGGSSLLKGGAGQVAKSGAGQAFKELAVKSGIEGAENMVDQIMTEINERGYYGYKDPETGEYRVIDKDSLTETAMAGALGALGGGMMHAGGKGLGYIGRKLRPDTPNFRAVDDGYTPVRYKRDGTVDYSKQFTPVPMDRHGNLRYKPEVDIRTRPDVDARTRPDTEADTRRAFTPDEAETAPVETRPLETTRVEPEVQAREMELAETKPEVEVKTPETEVVARPDEAIGMKETEIKQAKQSPIVGEQIKALEEAKAGADEATTARINKQIQDLKQTQPSIRENLPFDDTVRPVGLPIDKLGEIDSLKKARRAFRDTGGGALDDVGLKRALSEQLKDPNLSDDIRASLQGFLDTVGTPNDYKYRRQVAKNFISPKLEKASREKGELARALGLGKDKELSVKEMLELAGIESKTADRIAKIFDEYIHRIDDYNTEAVKIQKNFENHGLDVVRGNDVLVKETQKYAKNRSSIQTDLGHLQKKIANEIRALDNKGLKKQLLTAFEDVVAYRNANILSSFGLVERNVFQEIFANLGWGIKNPIKTARGMKTFGQTYKSAVKSAGRDWQIRPVNKGLGAIPAGAKYLGSNFYNTFMALAGTQGAGDARKAPVRAEVATGLMSEAMGVKLKPKEANLMAGLLGNEAELLVRAYSRVDAGLMKKRDADALMDAFFRYVKDPTIHNKSAYLEKAQGTSTIAKDIISRSTLSDGNKRALMAIESFFTPFMKIPTNLMDNFVYQTLNPKGQSILNTIGRTYQTKPEMAVRQLTDWIVDYGGLGAIYALASSGVLTYNPGDDDAEKVRGWGIKVAEDTYIPIRSTPWEVPLAVMGMTQKIHEDVMSDKVKDGKYYFGMLVDSLPYISQFEQYATTLDAVSGRSQGDGIPYELAQLGVSQAKGFAPLSNLSFRNWADGKQGRATDTYKTYDKDPKKWLINAIKESYGMREGLPKARDASGRIRTKDNQGLWTVKRSNDPLTRQWNDEITHLVEYGREKRYGKETRDMFNSYGQENNRFKAVHGAIAYIDKNPDGSINNETKLEQNADLYDLAQQIKNGYFGESGDELLTLRGENLYSDASVPNKSGDKNVSKPISMTSIRNAIAHAGLTTEQKNELYEAGQIEDKAEAGRRQAEILAQSETYQEFNEFMNHLNERGFFDEGGLGSTKSGQTYLWNVFNSLLGQKGKTPSAEWDKKSRGYGRSGGRRGSKTTDKTGAKGIRGLSWGEVKPRRMRDTKGVKYTPFKAKVKLEGRVGKDRTQVYGTRSF